MAFPFLAKLFGKNNKNYEYALSLDIGTEIVKALIFRIDDEEGKGIVEGVGKAREGVGKARQELPKPVKELFLLRKIRQESDLSNVLLELQGN